jgi:hypothetical protein
MAIKKIAFIDAVIGQDNIIPIEKIGWQSSSSCSF